MLLLSAVWRPYLTNSCCGTFFPYVVCTGDHTQLSGLELSKLVFVQQVLRDRHEGSIDMYHRMLSDLQLTAGQTEQVMAAMKQLFGRAIDKYVANVLPMIQVMQQRSFFCPSAPHNEQEFRQLFSEPQFAGDSWSVRVQRYCAKVPASASAGEFWQEQEHELPRLSVLAMQLLCVPSSSAYVESCFSVARCCSPF